MGRTLQRLRRHPRRANVFAYRARCARVLATLVAVWLVTPAAAARTTPGSSPADGAVAARSPRAERVAHLIVKYRATGPHALEQCAERLDRTGEAFAPNTADRAPRLDALRERLGLRRHRALFRAARGDDLAIERDRLARRLERRRAARFPRGIRGALASRTARPMPDLGHVYRVELPAAQDLAAAARALSADPAVEWAQLDGRVVVDQAAPFDDPFLSSSDSWGQGHADLWGLERVRAPEAWATTLGEGSVVAVVDTGLDYTHPDIADNLWVNPGEDLDGDGRFDETDRNGIDDDGNGLIDDGIGFDFADSFDADEDGRFDGPEDRNDADPFDVRGHGTHVAGTAAAVADNGEGIVGVAPAARVMALKGFPAEGSGRDSDLWRAVLYAAEQGADVVNNSWSCGIPCPTNPLARDVLAVVEALGTTVVTSAGNRTTDVASYAPENGDQVLTVGSIGFDDRLSAFSNFGWGIDVVAPGGGPTTAGAVRAPRRNILSLLPLAGLPNEAPFVVGERYRRLAGTSMSAPHVAGAVALLASLHPDLSPAEIRSSIRLAARELGALGHDPRYGPGALDLARLVAAPPVRAHVDWSSPGPSALVDPADGPLAFEVDAIGADVGTLDIAFARGLQGRPFEPLEHLEGARVDHATLWEGVRARVEWDPAALADGPVVLRARMTLADGRTLDHHRVVGVERVAPRPLGDGLHPVGPPALAAGRVVWPVARSLDTGAEVDLAVAAFTGERGRSRHPRAKPPAHGAVEGAEAGGAAPFVRIDVTGTPVDVVADGRLVAWRAFGERRFEIAWCALPGRRGRALTPDDCAERILDPGPGFPGRPLVGRGWIVWERVDGALRSIEGCRIWRRGRSPECAPQRLVDDVASGPPWRLLHFDGRRLLLRAGATLAFCTPAPDGTPCAPVPIEMAPGTPIVSEAIHDGDLLVLLASGVASRPPLGCLPGELDRDCVPNFAVTQSLLACAVDATDASCDPAPITEAVRLERFDGVRVDDGRIAWAFAEPLEETAIRVCTFDAATRTCPAQRLTGALGAQRAPDLDGARVVWLGARTAGESIWGHRLPELRLPETARVRAGRPFTIVGRAATGTAERLAYAVEVVEPVDARGAKSRRRGRGRWREGGRDEAWRARIEDAGRPGDRIRLVGRAPRGFSGEALVQVRATTDEGIEVAHTLRLEVDATPNVGVGNRPRGPFWPWRWWRDAVTEYMRGR